MINKHFVFRRAWALVSAIGFACAASFVPAAMAQGFLTDRDYSNWQEGEVPPPPALSTANMVRIEVPAYSEMQVGLDVNSVHVSHKDGVVRYVTLLQGRGGAVAAYYQGVHCNRFVGKTYARYRFDTDPPAWETVQEDWIDLREKKSSFANAIARAGACENSVAAASTRDARRAYRRNAKWRGVQVQSQTAANADSAVHKTELVVQP